MLLDNPPPKAADFTVAVTANAQAGTRYSNIPKPVLVKLGNTDRTTFSIRGDAVMLRAPTTSYWMPGGAGIAPAFAVEPPIRAA